MVNPLPSFPIRLADLVGNAYFTALYPILSAVLPEAHWWIMDENLERSPFPGCPTGPFCETARNHPGLPLEIKAKLLAARRSEDRGENLWISRCCENCLQGVAEFRFRHHVLGGIGLCHVPFSQQTILAQALRTLSGYLSLISGTLEDHDDLEIIHTLWSETVSMIRLDELLSRIQDEMSRSLGVGDGLILLINEDGEFYPAQVLGYPEAILKNKTLEVSRYEYMEKVERTVSTLWDLPPGDPLRDWFVSTLSALHHVEGHDRPCFAVPFLRKNYLIGVFLTLSEPGGFDSESKSMLLRMLASGAATAFDNALTLERMNQRRRALATIHVVHRLISAGITTKELLPRIGQLTRQLLKTKKCSIMLCAPQKKMLIPHVAIGLEEDEVGQKPLAPGEGLPGWVAENFNPLLYHPGGRRPPPWKSVGETYPSESYMAVALMDCDIEGVITVAEKESGFTPGDREILMTFAEQVVLAIKNAQLYEGERTITLNALKSISNLIETHDPAQTGITVKTCEWAQRIGRVLHLNEREQAHITYAALLHDFGMLRAMQTEIPIDEQRLKGPQLSLRFVQSLGLSPEVGEIVYHVNEAWDGQGYPEGFKGNRIPLGARIIAVANAFAIVLSRRNGLQSEDRPTREKAFRIVSRLRKRAFDPDVVSALEQAIRNPIPQEDL